MNEKILEVLNAKYKDRVLEFFTVNVYEEDETFSEWKLLLCESALVFAGKDEKPEDLGKYQMLFDSIKQVVAAKNSYFVIRIDLFDADFKNMPKVYIAIKNRRDFLSKLKVTFTTYNLIKRLEARNLPIFMEKLDQNVIKNLPKKSFERMLKIYFFDTEKWEQREHHGYTYLLPKLLVAVPTQKNMYLLNSKGNVYDLDRNNFVSFQVSRNVPLWAKDNMSSKNSLEYYAYDLLIDWLSFKNKVFTVEESTVYQKRLKLTEDSSRWMAHYIKARAIEKNRVTDEKFYVMVLRRIYIPPMLDIFDDIVLLGQFNETADKPFEALYKNAEGVVLDKPKDKPDFFADKIFLTAVDSVTSLDDQYPVPADFLSQVINGLGIPFL